MQRKQFTFYESFYDAIQCIGTKAKRVAVYDAICAYALYGQEPDMALFCPQCRAVLKVCLPILAAGRKKAEAGKKGGKFLPKQTVPMGSGEMGDAEMAAIQRMLAG